TQFSGKYFVVAPGTTPVRPPEIPFNEKNVFDCDTVLQNKALPKTMAIIGAGVIGCEYASIFSRLGVKVTLIDRRQTILRGVDDDVLKALTQHFSEHGITL